MLQQIHNTLTFCYLAIVDPAETVRLRRINCVLHNATVTSLAGVPHIRTHSYLIVVHLSCAVLSTQSLSTNMKK